jgi:hypothetical protein
MGEQGLALAHGIGQLLGIVAAQVARLARRRGPESSRPHEAGHEDVDVLVEIHLDE